MSKYFFVFLLNSKIKNNVYCYDDGKNKETSLGFVEFVLCCIVDGIKFVHILYNNPLKMFSIYYNFF